MDTDKNEAKRSVIRAGKELVESGLISRTWGNVSCRLDAENFLITPSGKDYMALTETDIVVVRIEDLSYEGLVKPSSEKMVHRDIYRLKPEVDFIVHTHQENASAVAALDFDVVTMDKEYPGIGRDIVIADYALPGTEALSKNVALAADRADGNAVILKNHGAVCYGRNRVEAFDATYELERACTVFLKKYVPIIAGEESTAANFVKEEPADEGVFLVKKKNLYIVRNTDKEVKSFSELNRDLLPYLDDFAQMVGLSARSVASEKEIHRALRKSSAVIVRGKGALCVAEDPDDAQTVSVLVRKNCKAYFTSLLAGGRAKPISAAHSATMRRNYLKNYSKLK